MMAPRRPEIDQTVELRRIIGGTTPNKPPHAQGSQGDKQQDQFAELIKVVRDWKDQSIFLLAGIFVSSGLMLLVAVVTALMVLIGE